MSRPNISQTYPVVRNPFNPGTELWLQVEQGHHLDLVEGNVLWPWAVALSRAPLHAYLESTTLYPGRRVEYALVELPAERQNDRARERYRGQTIVFCRALELTWQRHRYVTTQPYNPARDAGLLVRPVRFCDEHQYWVRDLREMGGLH